MLEPRRLRGAGVAAAQRWVTEPARRRFPRRLWRIAHRTGRRLAPRQFTDADPFTVVSVEPGSITHSVLETTPGYPQWGRVVGGEWDRDTRRFDERAVPRGIVQRFEAQRPWEETALYTAFEEQLERFGNAWGYTTIDGFERRCREIERLYDRLATDGYRSQRQLRRDGVANATPVLDEVNVDIGRDGTLLWRAYGQHRLAIAKLLGTDRIPVFVHRRHRLWQQIREAVRAGDDECGPDEHPDLRRLRAAV